MLSKSTSKEIGPSRLTACSVGPAGRYRGFSMVELMIVIAIIFLLVSLTTVVAGRLRTAAERSSTQQFLAAVKVALTQFHEDFGYYPPLLGDDPSNDFMAVLDENGRRKQGYYSEMTLVPYLIGIGDINRDNREDDDLDDGVPGPGFRSPGVDRAWGGADNAEDRRDYWSAKKLRNRQGLIAGRTYEPFLELPDGISLVEARSDQGEELRVYYLADYWETPIRYYRNWEDSSSFSATGEQRILCEWIAPIPDDEREIVNISLRSAPYVLFSAGPDQKDNTVLADDPVNEDNIVEFGF